MSYSNPYPHSITLKGDSAELQRVCDTLKSDSFPFRIIKEGISISGPGMQTNEISQLIIQFTGEPAALKAFVASHYKVSIS